VNDFLSFRRMVTPMIIQVIFWIFVAISVLGGLGLLVSSGSGEGAFFGLLYLIVGPLVARVYCEILIVIFRMNETLTDIRENTRPAPGLTQAASPPPVQGS